MCAPNWLCLILASGCCAIAGCHRSPPKTPVASVRTTDRSIVYEYDQGPIFLAVGDRGKVSHTFAISNPAKSEPLTFTIAQKPCSCTQCDLPAEPIPPGGTGQVRVSINPYSLDQFRSERVVLKPNLPGQKPVECVLAFHACPRVATSFGEVVQLSVEPGRNATKPFGVTLLQPEDELAAAIRAEVAGERLSVGEPIRTAVTTADGVRRTSVDLELAVDGSQTGQNDIGAVHEGELRVGYGDYWLKHRLEWSVRSEIEVAPRAPFLQPGHEQGRTRTVILKAREPFAVSSIETNQPWLHAQIAEGTDGRRATVQRLTVSVDPDVPEAEQLSRALLRVSVDHPRQTVVPVQLYLLWSAPPSIAAGG